MKSFQIFRYIKKWLPLVIAFFVVMTVLSYQMLKSRQKYTASAVIEYKTMEPKEGEEQKPSNTHLAPDGSEIDVTEINSSANMAKVMENLGLSYNVYSLDALCASIQVEPVNKEEETEDKDKDKENQPAVQEAPSYIVSCTLDSSASLSLVRDILNELLDVYFSDFSSQHINEEQINNQTKDLADSNYDYLEIVERIDAQLNQTLWALDARYRRAEDFRSVNTGYSFWDLCDEFSLIQDIEVPKLYALILGNQFTKDRALLLNKYQNRAANYELTSQKAQEDIADALEVIRSYVDKMRQSGNTDIDYNYILNDVHTERWDSGELVDRTGEYDELLKNWVNYRDRWDHAVIDAAYCEYILEVYRSGNTQLTVEIPTSSQSVDSAESSEESIVDEEIEEEEKLILENVIAPSTRWATEEEAQEAIHTVVNRMNDLYSKVALMNVEYNEYLGAQAIRILSSVSVGSSINLRLYMAIIGAFFLLVGCGGAVLLGRIEDILEYLFLRDRLTGCMNRPSCDNYIEKWEGKPLPSDMCCCNIQITNQRELNDNYGRERVDQAMKEFGRILRELFESRRNGFVGYNGSGQFWAFFEKESRETADQEMERLVMVLAQALSDIPMEYQLGGVNAGELEQFWIRGLISQAVKSRKPHTTGELLKKVVQ